MIVRCDTCFVKYETETVKRCPICYYSLKEERKDRISKEVKFMLSYVRGLKSMVVNSCKGQPRKSNGGFRLIDPFVGHRSLKK